MSKISIKFILKIFISLLVLSFAANAATLGEYRKNIQHLKEDLNSLIFPEDEQTDEDEQKFIGEVFDELPELFPAKQKIEWQGGSLETDNEWLIKEFTRFKDLEKDAPERQLILAEMYERLDAIEQKIIELENATASNRAKDDDKQKLAEILKREEYAKPQEKEESFVQKAYRRLMEWLKGLFPEPQPVEQKEITGFQGIPFFLQIVIYALLLAFIGFLIYKFAPFLISRFKTREKREKRERVILGEKIAAGETSDNLFGDAERMAQAGDLRGAIRKGYIALLCDLSDRKIIGLSKNKTNRDYLRDVRKRRELYQNMNGLTNNFERHWYGFQDADENDWTEFKDGYQKAVNSRL